MNLEVTGVTAPDHEIGPPPKDWSDKAAAVFVGFVLLALAVYMFMYHGDGVFMTAVPAMVGTATGFHGLRIYDDKRPDRKDG